MKDNQEEMDFITKRVKLNDGSFAISKEVKIDLIPKTKSLKTECPFLGTIKRNLLDFDFEKVCSVTNNNLNVYCCLVCGKYYQGKGANTYAYLHSLECNHHMFINLHNQKIYCLPEDYEIDNKQLIDIKVKFIRLTKFASF